MNKKLINKISNELDDKLVKTVELERKIKTGIYTEKSIKLMKSQLADLLKDCMNLESFLDDLMAE